MNKLYVIGLGPGGAYGMTAAARAALEEAEVICGYTVYLDLIAPLTPGKELRSTPMTRELDRCAMALELAGEGRTTALVCSGDAGVYGMASPVLELAAAYPAVEVEVVPGVTAALAGAAVLGAPLGGGTPCAGPAMCCSTPGAAPPPPAAGSATSAGAARPPAC